MPPLNWSLGALAVVRNPDHREKMERLFEAYFRAAGEKSEESLTGTLLHLDLPPQSTPEVITAKFLPGPRPARPLAQPEPRRYHFHARFTKGTGWVVEAVLKEEYRPKLARQHPAG